MVKLDIDPKYRKSEAKTPLLDGGAESILSTTYKPIYLFQYAQNDWRESFKTQQSKKSLEKLLKAGNLKDPKTKAKFQSELDWLAKMRKSGTRYCDAWKFLDTNQKPPEPIKNFVRNIGKFKDAVWSNGVFAYDPQTFLNQITAIHKTPEFQFQPMNFHDFLKAYNQKLVRITKLNKTGLVTLDDHHTLRRAIRSMKHHYGLIAHVTGNKDAESIERLLEPVSFEMGKAQNLIVDLEVQQGIDIAKELTTIQPRHRLIINDFLSLHRKS